MTDRTYASKLRRRDFVRTTGLLAAGVSSGPLLVGCGSDGSSGDQLTVWWNEGFYPAEDKAAKSAVRAWEKKSGTKVSLQFYGTNDIVTKAQSAITAGKPPDIVYAEKNPTPDWAWQGRLEDVSDVVEGGDYTDSALQSVRLYNERERGVSYYGVPMHQFAVSLFYWKSLVDQAGLDPEELPSDWKGYWNFWRQVQDELRKGGNAKKHAIGWPMGSAAGDTNYDTETILVAHGVELLDDSGQLRANDAEVKRRLADGLGWISDLYKQGYTPKSSINWQDADNNTHFLGKSVVMTPNGSLSIPGSIKDEQPDDLPDLVTTDWPNAAGGSATPTITQNHNAVVFADAPNKDAAKDLLKFVTKPENNGPILRGSRARWFPCQDAIMNHPYWSESDDPHIQVAAKQLAANTRAGWAQRSPAYAQAENKGMWGNILGDIVQRDTPVLDAAEEALSQLEQLFEKYSRE